MFRKLFVLLLTLPTVSWADFTLSTYNLGLAYTFVPLAEERAPHLVEAIKELDSDVVCLQEVWAKEDQERILEGLKNEYPYSLVAPFNQKYTSQAPACGPWQLFGPGGFGSCLVWNCAAASGDALTQCVIQTCREPLNELKQEDPECAQALMAQVGKSAPKAFATVMDPRNPVGLFSFEGSAGLVLLSRHPIDEAGVLDMAPISTLNRRAALRASVNVNGIRRQVLCTHLTANLDSVAPYAGSFSSWSAEALEQTKTVLTYMGHKSGANAQYFLGDFNCSLKRDDTQVAEDFSESCNLFKNNGLADLYFDQIGLCTFCADNTLNAGSSDNRSYVLDHIFSKNTVFSNKAVSSRELTRKVEVKTREGKTVSTNLSDHYAVKVKFIEE